MNDSRISRESLDKKVERLCAIFKVSIEDLRKLPNFPQDLTQPFTEVEEFTGNCPEDYSIGSTIGELIHSFIRPDIYDARLTAKLASSKLTCDSDIYYTYADAPFDNLVSFIKQYCGLSI